MVTPEGDGITVADYAAAKGLPEAFLRSLGVTDAKYQGSRAVRTPFWGSDQTDERTVQYRLRLAGDRFRFKVGTKPCAYGLWRLDEARTAQQITLVEGPSDAQTLWYHDQPALGLQSASAWPRDLDDHLKGIDRVNVVIEPDKGGEAVLKHLANAAFRDRVHLLELGDVKDPSGLYLSDPDHFTVNWQSAVRNARPFLELQATTETTQAEEHYRKAHDLLHDPDILCRVGEAMRASGYAGDLMPVKTVYVAMTSRLLPRAMNVALIAESGSGKTHSVDKARELMPPEAIYIERAGSARALIYVDEDFQHRVVVCAEADSIPDEGPAASAIRSLASENVLAYDVVEKNPDTHQFQTRRIEKPGPTGLITTSTRPLAPQMATRMLEVSIRDDKAQTRQVARALARSVQADPGGPAVDLEAFVALQRYLAHSGIHDVHIPFAGLLAEKVPVTAVRVRRDFRQLLTCIQAVALLHHRQRTVRKGIVEAEISDYTVARELLSPIFDAVVSDGVTPVVREVVDAVRGGEVDVSVATLAKRLGLSRSTASYRVRRALAGSWLVNAEDQRGRPARLSRGVPLPNRASALPEPSDLEGVTNSPTEIPEVSTSPQAVDQAEQWVEV